jgi:beta-lactamase regulating signal transducer with metallopeptidase domain
MSLLELLSEEPLVYRLGCALVHSLWEGMLIAAALAVVLRVLRDRPTPRYAAAWVALVLMGATVPVTAWLVEAPQTPSCAPSTTPPPARSMEDTPPGTQEGAADPAPAMESVPVAAAALLPGGAPLPSEASPAPGRVSPLIQAPSREILRPVAPWAVATWVAGVALLSLWRLGGWLYLRRLCQHEARPASPAVQAVFDGLLDRLQVRTAVRLVESLRVDVPAVVGWLRPVLLLPVGILGGVPPHELELILTHELAHVRRRDFLANLIQTAVETCLFYHPAAWWVGRQIRAEREACCDDAVVAATGERLLYARALARLEEFRAVAAGVRLSRLSVAADGGSLRARIRRVLGVPGEERYPSLPQLAASSAALLSAVALSAFLAFGKDPLPAQAGPSPAPEAGPPAPERPRVVQVFPPKGATDVDPITEIRIRFDQAMDRTSASLVWGASHPAGFRVRGEPRYAEGDREFVLPVQLSPGLTHEITLNGEDFSRGKDDDESGFRSTDRIAAQGFRWSFTTRKLPAKDGKPPRAVSVSPASDTEVSILTPLEVTFDQPMDPVRYGLGLAEPGLFERQPELVGNPVYDPARHRFTLWTRLPPNWNGELQLQGFCSSEGVEAAPVTLKYRTLRTLISEAQRARIEQAGRSAEFRQLVERVRKARRGLTSVSEEALWTIFSYQDQAPGWLHSFESYGSRFHMQGTGKFRGDVDAVMRIPFRIGSDGTTCWLRRRNDLISLPAKDVEEKHLRFCDPFDAAGTADADGVIREQKLEYLGETTVRGQRCHRVRSWAIGSVVSGWRSPVRDWFLDAATLLPTRVEMTGIGIQAIDFTYTRINQPIPDEEFRPEAGGDVKVVPAEPLAEGYTRRFLNVIDGSNGRMSVRWGMQGPKGTNSCGLN